MTYTFGSALVLLLLIMDPFGNYPLFASVLKKYDRKERMFLIVRENIIAFGILLGFMLAGESFLNLMGLSRASIEIAGAVILFLIALKMIFQMKKEDEVLEHKPLIVPLAVPAIAGPSAMATVMLLVNNQPNQVFSWVAVLAVAIIICATILIVLDRLDKFLGVNFLSAMEKLMGLVLVALSVEMFIRGVKSVIV